MTASTANGARLRCNNGRDSTGRDNEERAGWTNLGGSIERVLWVCARPAPRGPMPVREATRFPPLAGIRADDWPIRLPTQHAQWRFARRCPTDGAARAWIDPQELRSLYRCEDSAGWLVRADFAPCFPFNCARCDTARGHQSAASVEVADRHVKKRGMSRGFRRSTVKKSPCLKGKNAWQVIAHPDDALDNAALKRYCYVSKRDKCPSVRHSALECHVFRGRSTCSPNSKHCHRTSAG